VSIAQERQEPADASVDAMESLPFLRLPSEYPVRRLDELTAVCRFLDAFPERWWIGGGWAIDVWAGAPSREHEDIEICVMRHDQAALQAYCADWQFFTPVNDQWAPMAPGELLEFPRSMWQLRRSHEVPAVHGMPPEFEFILNDVIDGQWIFRYDPEIQVPFERVFGPSPCGLPVTAPEILLLHKAWHIRRPKDEHDFQRVRARLSLAQRRWLRTQLARIRPTDPWRIQLE
jgi:hypothetical protein